MSSISAELKRLLGRASLVVLPEDYVIVYLPIGIKALAGEWFLPATTRFAAVIQEPNLITMVIPRQKWMRMQSIFDKCEVHGPFKVVSFNLKLSLVARGYMAAIGSVLTENKIGALPVSSFKHDHIIVPKAELPHAVRVLRNFLESHKTKSPQKKQ